MNGLFFPITLTLQAALTSLVLFAVIGVPLTLYTARSKTRVSRTVLFLATLRSRIPFKSTRAVQPGTHGNYSPSHQVSLAPDGMTSQGRFTKRRLAS